MFKNLNRMTMITTTTVPTGNKKLIRRWNSERERSLRHRTRYTHYKNTIDSCINSSTNRRGYVLISSQAVTCTASYSCSCELVDAHALSTHRSRVLVRRQFSLPAYTRVTKFCHIFGRRNGGRLIRRTAYTRVYKQVYQIQWNNAM